MANIIIRRARLLQAKEILEIQKLAFQSEAEIHKNYGISPLVQTIESIEDDFSTYHFYIAVLENKIIGSVKVRLIENIHLWIGRLVVHPDYQGRGIGKKIMVYVENKYRNVEVFLLYTAEKSIRNVTFYKSLGYEISGKYTEPGHSDIILVKLTKINSIREK